MSKIWVPKGIKISDKICIISDNYKTSYAIVKNDAEPHKVSFSSKLDELHYNALAIVNNVFTGPFRMGDIYSANTSFHADLYMENILPSNDINITFRTPLKYWEINEIIQSGVIGKDGNIDLGTEFVIATYSSHFCPILKDGLKYNEIMGI